jgi:hypothetical protein
MGYQPRSNFPKDENCILLAESHSISNGWKNYSSRSLNSPASVMLGRQIYTSTAEPLVSGPSPFDSDISIPKLKKYKSSGTNQISAELSQLVCETLRCVIHKLLDCLISELSVLLYQFTR